MAADGRMVLVLAGGASPEREISLQGGEAVSQALHRAGLEVLLRDPAEPDFRAELMQLSPSCAFVMLHGPGGEDGVIQGVLQDLNIPCTGSGILSSALSWDKLRCKYFWRGVGLPTADFLPLNEELPADEVLQKLGKCVVKPACGGSSLGITIVTDQTQLADAIAVAARYPGPLLAERWVDGSEYTVAILAGEALPVVQVAPQRTFYDYEAKYGDSGTRYCCPSDLSSTAERELQRIALQAFSSLGCDGWGRVDFVADSGGNFWLLEVNTVPGMVASSLVPKAAAAAGLDFDALTLRILATVLS